MSILAVTLYLHIYAISISDPGRSYGTARVSTGRTTPGGGSLSLFCLIVTPGDQILEFMDLSAKVLGMRTLRACMGKSKKRSLRVSGL